MEREEEEDKREADNLTIRVRRLEEQMKRMGGQFQ